MSTTRQELSGSDGRDPPRLDRLLGVLMEEVGPDFIRRELAGFARWADEALGRLGELEGAT